MFSTHIQPAYQSTVCTSIKSAYRHFLAKIEAFRRTVMLDCNSKIFEPLPYFIILMLRGCEEFFLK